jgi:hypothetical protein
MIGPFAHGHSSTKWATATHDFLEAKLEGQ